MLAAWPPTTDPEIQKRYKLYQEIQATADWIMMASVWSITIKVRPVILETSYQISKIEEIHINLNFLVLTRMNAK